MEKSDPEFAAFIGIDWADHKHDVCLMAAGTDVIERAVHRFGASAVRRPASPSYSDPRALSNRSRAFPATEPKPSPTLRATLESAMRI